MYRKLAKQIIDDSAIVGVFKPVYSSFVGVCPALDAAVDFTDLVLELAVDTPGGVELDGFAARADPVNLCTAQVGDDSAGVGGEVES